MLREEIIAECENFFAGTPLNRVTEGIALSPELAGLNMFERPGLGFAGADDPLFSRFQEPGIIGPHYLRPADWLPEAKTVLSFFLPFTAEVRAANRRDFAWPAREWLHARVDGQKLVAALSGHLRDVLRAEGYAALAPLLDPRFRTYTAPRPENPAQGYRNSSNWSERHAAYACGLGCFGLSRGLITRRGMAGRFGSVITSLPLAPDARPSEDPFAWCIRCGKCARNCPARAISLEKGKDNRLCGDFLQQTTARHQPYYGCGKCQVAVPCETRRP
jgi:epoxyqueuosine reductase QueG